ncbi:hypothetical protein EW146_g3266 [Bondarzewia mesenterica]|uniref:Uncharacterized protein n=1 Tax=Bondarzewia mesenterica TaxID=1095465 RepID=A0A4S4LZX6_9AGAM|nr:hypothetical protein EW146_g3266 [Bondarzewia mesenterica]
MEGLQDANPNSTATASFAMSSSRPPSSGPPSSFSNHHPQRLSQVNLQSNFPVDASPNIRAPPIPTPPPSLHSSSPSAGNTASNSPENQQAASGTPQQRPHIIPELEALFNGQRPAPPRPMHPRHSQQHQTRPAPQYQHPPNVPSQHGPNRMAGPSLFVPPPVHLPQQPPQFYYQPHIHPLPQPQILPPQPHQFSQPRLSRIQTHSDPSASRQPGPSSAPAQSNAPKHNAFPVGVPAPTAPTNGGDPYLTAFEVLKPTKDLLEKTWSATVSTIQREVVAHSGTQHNLARMEAEYRRLWTKYEQCDAERARAVQELQAFKAPAGIDQRNFSPALLGAAHQSLRKQFDELLDKRESFFSPLPSPPLLQALCASVPTARFECIGVEAYLLLLWRAGLQDAHRERNARMLAEQQLAEVTERLKQTTSDPPQIRPRPHTQRPLKGGREREADEGGCGGGGSDGEHPRKRVRISDTQTMTTHEQAHQDGHGTVQEPMPVTDAEPAAVADTAASPARAQLGIQHINLVYWNTGDTLVCRMCQHRRQNTDATVPIVSFHTNASWTELRGHCEEHHPAACEALLTLSPSELAEMRQRVIKQ